MFSCWARANVDREDWRDSDRIVHRAHHAVYDPLFAIEDADRMQARRVHGSLVMNGRLIKKED